MSRLDTRTVRYLNHLPGIVVQATPDRITWDEWFKRDVARRLRLGDSPARVFRQAGVGSEVIGYKRIERCCARWRSKYPGMRDDPLDSATTLLQAGGAYDIHVDEDAGTITFGCDGHRYRIDLLPETVKRGGDDA